MEQPGKLFFNWSTGKDSSLALYRLRQQNISADLLLTNVNSHHNRVSMHGVRRELLVQQAQSLGIPLKMVELPEEPGHEEYSEIMRKTLFTLKEEGFSRAAFGDIFLEDLRNYRERQLAAAGIKAEFPIWNCSTSELMSEFLSLGFKAIVVCVDGSKLSKSFAGRLLDNDFLADLPEGVDPCGENGEFHTFCFDGPIFAHPVSFRKGETVTKSYVTKEKTFDFHFCELLAAE